MTKGLIKLSYKGKNDKELIGNPKICFWKNVYKQHTNFVKQTIEIDCGKNVFMKNTCGTVFKFRVDRNADLVTFASLSLTLPKIFSKRGHHGEFTWIKNIGCSMIEYARLYYDNILIEEIDGDFLITNRDMLFTNDKKTNFNKLTGNVCDLYDPYTNGVYPSFNNMTGNLSGADFYINSDYNTPCSIDNYKLDIPLMFCFFREKSFIPLVSLKYREVFIEVKLRPLKELYTIIERGEIALNIPADPLTYFFLTPAELAPLDLSGLSGETLSDASQNSVNFDKRIVDPDENIFRFTHEKESYFVPTLDLEYIFLDNKEREELALRPFSQTFSFSKKLSYKSIEGKKKLYIDKFHPVQSVYLTTKRDDRHLRNEWSNYTNRDYDGQNTLHLQNLFTLLAKNEAKQNSHTNFFKHLGTFMGKGNQNYTCIVEEQNYTDVSGRVHSLKGYDFLIKKPKFPKKISFNMILTFLLVLKGGKNYISTPKIKDKDGNLLSANVTIKKGVITNIQFSKSKTYDDYTNFYVEPQLYMDSLIVTSGGNGYESLPLLLYYTNNTYKNILYSAQINKGGVKNIYLKNKLLLETKQKLFLGGILEDITNINKSYSGSFSFFNPNTNNVRLPKVYMEDNKLKIKDHGAGLSTDTRLVLGKFLDKIDIAKNIILRKNIASYEVVPKYFSKFSKSNYTHRHTTIPELDIIYLPLKTYDVDYKINYDNTPKLDIVFDNKVINNKIHFTINGKISDRDVFLNVAFQETYSSFNLGKFKQYGDVDIKIIQNFKTNITKYLDNFILHQNNRNLILTTNENFKNIGIKEGDNISLYICNKEISTIKVQRLNDILLAYNYPPHYNSLKNIKETFIFTNISNKIFTIEYGKKIASIDMYSDITQSSFTLSNNTGRFIDLSSYCNKENKNKYTSTTNIEFDFGGNPESLHPFLDYTIKGGNLHDITFNENYYDYGHTWTGYNKKPLFIVKDISINRNKPFIIDESRLPLFTEDYRRQNDINYKDAIVEGIIDNGGDGFEGKIIYNSYGFGGEVLIKKRDSLSLDIFLDHSGYNYPNEVNSCLISYEIIDNRLFNLQLLESFTIKTNITGGLDNRGGILWKEETPISTINILTENNVRNNNEIYNPRHNDNTIYKVIIGNIPSKNIGIINKGKNFIHTKELLFETKTDNLLFNYSFEYKKTIENGEIINLQLQEQTHNGIKIPLLSYKVENNTLILLKKNIFIETKKQLTGFKILDGGDSLSNQVKLYNGFISKLPNIKSSAAIIETNLEQIPLDTKGDHLQFYPENMFYVFNNNFNQFVSKYINILSYKKNQETKGSFIDFSKNTKIIYQTDVEMTRLIPKVSEYIFTEYSEIFPSSTIKDIKIIHPGNDMDDMFNNYKLLFRDIDRNVIDIDTQIEVCFKGKNSKIKNNKTPQLVIKGDGKGVGCSIESTYKKGEDCRLLSIMGINKSSLDCGNGYDAKDINMGYTNSDHLCSNIYTWNSIPSSSLIHKKDWITLNDIKKFMNIWRYRSPMNIPILDKNNYKFYKDPCIVTKFGINIDFKERENIRDAYVYNTLEKYYSMKDANYNCNILYSFCLNNNSFQPTGSINLSSLDNMCLNLELKNPHKDSGGEESYKYDADVFLKYYNVIEYVNGKGGLKYGN